MYCWNCGHKNPDQYKYCGDCGEIQGRPARAERTNPGNTGSGSAAGSQLERPDSSALRSESREQRAAFSGQRNRITEPLVEYIPPKSNFANPRRRASDAVPPASVQPAAATGGAADARRETSEKLEVGPLRNFGIGEGLKFANPLIEEPRTIHERVAKEPDPLIVPKKQVNRISGPSFLGLSGDDSADDASYLLQDDETGEPSSYSSSTWRGALALTLLIVFGILAVRQWSVLLDFAGTYAQKAEISLGKQHATKSGADPIHHPPAAVSAETVSSENNSANTGDSASNKTNSSGKDAEMASNAASSAAGDAPGDEVADQKPESDKNSDADSTNSRSSLSSARSETKKVYDNSQVQLAEKYIYGRGVPEDCGRALSLLQSAAAHQNPSAEIKLGALYSTGHCVTQDRAQAYRWYARAQQSEPGNTWLQYSLNSLWASMTEDERRRAQSM